jgi:hypothetical protein
MSNHRLNEEQPSRLSDEQLISELEHWGRKRTPSAELRVDAIQLQAKTQSASALRMSLAACVVATLAVVACLWTPLGRPPVQHSASDAVSNPSPVVAMDPKSLLRSISKRAQEIEERIEILDSILDQKLQADLELQSLRSQTLHYKRIAIRNELIMNHSLSLTP